MLLRYTPAARKDLAGLPAKVAAAIMGKLDAIAADPFAPHASATKLVGTVAGYRVRHGDWRAKYHVDGAAGLVVVERVQHRSDVYR